MAKIVVAARGCGFPKEGGLYLLSLGGPGGILPPIVLLMPPIGARAENSRSASYVSGDDLLKGLPEAVWSLGQATGRSRDDERHHVAQAWE